MAESLPSRSKLSNESKRWMFGTLIRGESLWPLVEEQLAACRFLDADLAFKAVVDCAALLKARHRRLAKGMLVAELDEGKRTSRLDVSDDEYEDAVEYVGWLFDGYDSDPDDSETTKWALDRLRQYFIECYSTEFFGLFGKHRMPEDVGEAMRTGASRVASFQSLGGKTSNDLFGDQFMHSFAAAPLARRSTGVVPVDHLTTGGDLRGEVYGFLGPYGSCKTLLSVQLCCNAAMQAYAKAQAGGRHESAVFVTYECSTRDANGGPGELQLRILASLGQISLDSLVGLSQSGGDISTLSTSDRLKPYERELFRDKIELGECEVLGEYERMQRAMHIANRHIVAVDLSGSSEEQDRGSGWVPEIVGCLRADTVAKRFTPNFMVVDYCGFMVDNYAEATGQTDSYAIARLMKRGPELLKKLVAQPFNIPVWVAHQLNGAANSKGFGAKMHHTDAEGGKSFARGCYNAIVIGGVENQRFQMSNDKTRGSAPVAPRTVEIQGNLMRLVDVSDEFVRRGNRIISRNEDDIIADAEVRETRIVDTRRRIRSVDE